MPKCKVCHHPRRQAIDLALLAGESLDILVRVTLPGGSLGPAPVFQATVGWAARGSERRRYAEAAAFIVYGAADEARLQENHLGGGKGQTALGFSPGPASGHGRNGCRPICWSPGYS
jgi:hypothetical protein